MHASQNSFAQSRQAGMESLTDLAHAQFTAVERLLLLNFNFARSTFNHSAAYASALLVGPDKESARNGQASKTAKKKAA